MGLDLDRLDEIKIVDSNGDELGIDGSGNIGVNVQGTVTVDAVNLDIRDLTHVSDNVGIGDGTNLAAVNASLELQVRDDDANTDLDTIAGAIHLEDSAHTTADPGIFALAVRQDADAAFGADGDYSPLQVDSSGFLKVAGSFTAAEDAYDTIKSTAETVGVAAAEIVSTPLTNRKRIIIQNKGSVSSYVGPTGVTTASGLEISKKSSLEFKASATANIFMISGSAAQDHRVFEMAD